MCRDLRNVRRPTVERLIPFSAISTRPISRTTKIDKTWSGSTRMCTYCGCVYSDDGSSKTVRGYLNNGVLGARWKPIGRAAGGTGLTK
jgi:hypothetical protein